MLILLSSILDHYSLSFAIQVTILNEAAVRNIDFLLIYGNFILITEDRSYLFEWNALRIREEEEHDDTADGARDNESKVELPANIPRISISR